VSFILDAIAKSEHDRQQQEVPGVHTLAPPVGSEKRPRRVFYYLMIAALLLNVIVLVIWMQSDRSLLNRFTLSQGDTIEQSTEPAVVAENSSTRNRVTPAEVAVTVTPSKSTMDIVNAPPKPAAATTSPPESVAQTEKTVSTSKPRGESKVATVVAPRDTDTDLAGTSRLTPPQPVAETTSTEDTAWVRVEPDTLSSKIQPGDLTNQSTDEQGSREAMPRKLTRLSDLPADVRKDLPSVEFSGHLYSSNPKSSYVFVSDGRPVTEGQQIVDELILYKITPTGVILEFKGYLIDVGVLQHWNLN
jgi:general secretion pathway protein B